MLKSMYDFPIYLLGYSFNPLHQFICIQFISLGFIFIINCKWKLDCQNLLALVFLISLLLAIYKCISNEKNNYGVILSHFYYYIMPVISLSYGAKLSVNSIAVIKYKIEKIATKNFWILILLSIIYYYLHSVKNIWDYYGYSSGLIFACILSKQNFIKNLCSFVIDILSGKRSSVVLWLMYFISRRPIITFISIIMAILVLYPFWDNIPDRYQNLISLDIFDEKSLFNATGGRSVEWFGIWAKIFENTESALIGHGLGSTYFMNDIISEQIIEAHYSHMTFFTYAMISGIISALAIIILLIFIMLKLVRSEMVNKSMLNYIVLMFVISLSGPSLLVEPLPWFLVGILINENNINTNTHDY